MASKQKYDAEFKRRAVEMFLTSDKSGPQIAEELGIDAGLLYKWKCMQQKNPQHCFPGNGNRDQGTPEEEEIRRLKLENEDLRMERDILKKAAAIFLKK